jgi:RimJ/RimL family protein N-acetyltransferase
MLIHTPLLAEYSPGKLHIMHLSEHLMGEGLTTLDLTPGGDAWKERFANDHDEVVEAVVHVSTVTYQRSLLATHCTKQAKRALGAVGVAPDDLRSMLALVRRATPAALVRKATHWLDERREFRVYRCERSLVRHQAEDPRVHRDSFADLLHFEPSEIWQTRQGFLSAALLRLEQGHTSWTICQDGKLAHSGWMVAQTESKMSEVEQTLTFPSGSVALYDFYSAPEFRGRGFYRATIAHMLRAAFQDQNVRYAYISVLADNEPSRHVIETLGFSYQGSFHWHRRFGRVSKWADTFSLELHHA